MKIKRFSSYAYTIEQHADSLRALHSDRIVGSQLSKGNFQGHSSSIDLCGIQITKRESQAKCMSSGYINDAVVICFPLDNHNFYSNGVEIESGNFSLTALNREFGVIFMGNNKHLVLRIELNSIKKHLKEDQAAELISAICKYNDAPNLGLDGSLSKFIENIFSYLYLYKTEQSIEDFDSSTYSRMIIYYLYDYMCLKKTFNGSVYSSQAKVIQRSLEYALKANQLVSIDNLSSEAFASKRAIQYAFSNILSMSPAQFIKAYRFNQVRRDLLKANRSNKTIRQVLRNYHITNLSRFKHEYSTFFKESPEITASKILQKQSQNRNVS